MAKKSVKPQQEATLLPATSEWEWWRNQCRIEAQAHYVEELAQEYFRRWLSPAAAAKLMRER